MSGFLKYLAYSLAGLLSLVLVLVLTLLLRFNADDYKQVVMDAVQQKTGRTLKLDGEIRLAFWPKLGANLGALNLSEKGSQKPFASVARVQVSLALLPLLEKKLVLGTVYLDGINATLIQHADGSNNFSDLFDGDSNTTLSYAIDGLDIRNSRIHFLNEATKQELQLSQLQLTTGRIMKNKAVDAQANFTIQAKPAELAAQVNLSGQYLFNTDTQHFSAKNLRLSLQGNAMQAKQVQLNLNTQLHGNLSNLSYVLDDLRLSVQGNVKLARLQAELTAAHIMGKKTQLSSPEIKANVSLNSAPHDLNIRWLFSDVHANASSINIANANTDLTYVNGKRSLTSQFTTPISAQIHAASLDLAKLSGQLTLHDSLLKPAGLKASFQLSAQADFKHEIAHSRFHFTSGPSLLSGELAVSHMAKPKLQFKLAAQQWDLNAYLASKQKTATKGPNPIDLSALSQVNLDGQVTLEKIAYAPYQLHKLHTSIKTEGQTLRATGIALRLDDSRINGDVAMSLQSPHAYSMHLAVDKLNLNRYQAAGKSSPKNEQTALDLDALKGINASGDIRIGQLSFGDNRANNVRIALQAQPEKLNSPKMSRHQP